MQGLSAGRAVHRSSLFQPRQHNWELCRLALVSKLLCLYFPSSPVSFSPYLSSALCYLFLPHLSLHSADELGCCSGRKLIFTLTEVARQVMLSSGSGILLALTMIRNGCELQLWNLKQSLLLIFMFKAIPFSS